MPRALVLAATLVLALPSATPAQEMPPAAEIDRPEVSGFAFEHTLTLPGTPDRIWEVITGDISGWWDHNFSGDPAVFIIEPWPGGRFLEQFEEDARDGVLHATVTVAIRPRLLRMEGPLGLTGRAVHGVYSLALEPAGEDSTRVTHTTQMLGAGADEWAEVVERAWRHFLFEGLKPYVEAGLTGPQAWVTGRTLWIQSWPRLAVTVDPPLRYLGARTFDLYDVAAARTHVFVDAAADSVVRRLYWLQVEEVLPGSDHRYDYSDLTRRFERAGHRFVADARFGPGYSLDNVDDEGDTAEVLRLLAEAGYRMPESMMRLRAVTLDTSGRRELLFLYIEDLATRGVTATDLEDDAAWERAAAALQTRALEGLTFRRW